MNSLKYLNLQKDGGHFLNLQSISVVLSVLLCQRGMEAMNHNFTTNTESVKVGQMVKDG